MADQEESTFFLSVVPFRQEILKVNAYVVSSIQAAADFRYIADNPAVHRDLLNLGRSRSTSQAYDSERCAVENATI